MAWNQPGSGNKDPWKGRDPGNEVEAFLNRLKGMFGGNGGGRGGNTAPFNPLPWLLALGAVWVLFNSFKLMDERQRGVVLRFGEFNRVMTPGPNFKWPWPIESVFVVDATQVLSVSDQVRVLTKDENIVDIKFNAQYRRTDPRTFLFGSREPELTLQQAAEAAVREVVGTSTMDTVLFQRAELVVQARQRLQESLNFYNTGLELTEFNLPDARPPEEVKPAFDEVNSAQQIK
ncbi:MAG TPA: FtsH protease activity modulator HflK, partial [Arenimonas sp.]|nr:FtsH protease activity modulator HflK [Arenimonas sp.]